MDRQPQPTVAYDMSQHWLIAVSGVAHLAVGVGLFASGVWRIERLHADPLKLTLRQPLSLPAPSSGPVAAQIPEIPPKPRRVIVKEPTQPVPRPPETPATSTDSNDNPGPDNGSDATTDIDTCTENCGAPTAAAPVCGDGSVDASEGCDDGNTTGADGCSSTCQLEPKPRPSPTALVPPNVLQGLRISGETQIHPNAITQNSMIREGASRVQGILKVCLATDGSVASVSMLRSTKYDAYDATLLSSVRDWRYRPYLLNGTPVPACSTVTFHYTMK
jgi:TonB family protein